jgi:hypothetical protein
MERATAIFRVTFPGLSEGNLGVQERPGLHHVFTSINPIEAGTDDLFGGNRTRAQVLT